MTSKNGVWNGFTAAMVHDIGKFVSLGKYKHEDLDAIKAAYNIDFDSILGEDVTKIIKNHHNSIKDIDQKDNVQISLILGDRFEKAMYAQQEENKFNKLLQSPKFYPFYGFPTSWSVELGMDRLKQILNDLKLKKTGKEVQKLIDVQKYMSDFPSITYLPYISLAMHHRFTAVLFLVIYFKLKKGASPLEITPLKFSFIDVRPDPLKLFYRLRDVKGHKQIVDKLNKEIFRDLFTDYASMVQHGMSPDANPFNFYHRDGFVFLYDNEEKAIRALKQGVNKIEDIHSIKAHVNNYTLSFDWKSGYADPEKTGVEKKTVTIMPDGIMEYRKDAVYQCSACGKPVAEFKVIKDDEGNILCPVCFSRRQYSTRIEIDRIAEKNGKKGRIGYVFVSLPDNLTVHSQDIARDKLLSRFIGEFSFHELAIEPTETGLFEYLQVLLELKDFQNDISNKIEEIKKEDSQNFPCEILFELPDSMCYLFREHEDDTQLWDFLHYLNIKRFDLQLDSSAKVFICNYKTPFWSLIDFNFHNVTYLKGDMFCNISGGNITMFLPEEVRKIRELAEIAKKDRVYPTQLERLARVALETNVDELLLEIDARADRLRGFEKKLMEGIKSITEEGTDYQNREKRSIFIKYIAKLAGQKGFYKQRSW